MKWKNLWIKKFCRLYLNEIAFNLIPQQLFCTKAIYIMKSRKKHDFEILIGNDKFMYCLPWL